MTTENAATAATTKKDITKPYGIGRTFNFMEYQFGTNNIAITMHENKVPRRQRLFDWKASDNEFVMRLNNYKGNTIRNEKAIILKLNIVR